MSRLKICKMCGVEKPATLAEFVIHSQCRDRVGPYCRPCYSSYQKSWKQKNHARISEARRQIYAERYGERQRELERRRKLICWRCNNIKRNYKAIDLRLVADWLDSRGNEVDKFNEAAE